MAAAKGSLSVRHAAPLDRFEIAVRPKGLAPEEGET